MDGGRTPSCLGRDQAGNRSRAALSEADVSAQRRILFFLRLNRISLCVYNTFVSSVYPLMDTKIDSISELLSVVA